MIRRSTILGIAFVCAVGAGLYQLKHEVMMLEKELGRVNRAILDDQESIHVLRAEWTYLNEPRRLEALSQRYLKIAPLSAAQVVTIEDLPNKLDSVITDANNPPAGSGATKILTGAAR